MNPYKSNHFVKYRHRFETTEGWTLCTWCGRPKSDGYIHVKLPPGFRSIATAPQNATEIEVCYEDGETLIAHFAQDLSGEDQPPFKGWFTARVNSEGKFIGWRQIDEPDGWRPIHI